MLNRSRSWPVQSVVTLDPRGIVYSKIQTRNGLTSKAGRTPDIVLEANERAWTRPDIFPSLDSRGGRTAEEKPKECQTKQLQFVDHYKLLDSTETADTEFAIRVPSEGASATRNQVPTTRALPAEIPIIGAHHEDSLLLNSYQIDLLRKKSYKERDDVRSLRRTLERKPTTEFESIASNETKTTDIDDKGNKKKTTGRRDSSATPHLIRSYSLGYEQTEEKVTRTFKKFSLPTPQLKDIGDNPEEGVVKRKTVSDVKKVSTLTRHYYPEGGWGFVIVLCSVIVQTLCHGLQMASGVIMVKSAGKFKVDIVHTGWLGALSTAVALFLSPITIAFCRRKSTRVTAVVGGLVTALGCLFTSFASQFHQLFFSYGTVIGVGVGLTRDCSTLMVAQYFKRRRELVEIFIVSGSGLGISVMSACIQGAINAIGWRLGLQAITGAVFMTFILGMFYRSASLYHPQRRAILHLKNQKRKIKDKNKVEDKPAFLDTSTLRSKTVRILLASTGLSAFGVNTPIFYLARQAEEEGLGERAVLLQAYLGLAWVLGCASFGLVVVHNSVECRIARQYLCQAAVFMCGLAILALTTVHGNYHGYVLFVWIYGIFCGGYHYSLKMYTYERVRARNFARTWGFVQCSQAIPIALGVPISGYMNEGCGGKAGYYFSSTCTLAGSIAMFLIDVHRRRIARHKHTRENGQKHLCESETCPRRRPSLGAEPDPEPQVPELPAAELIPGLPGEKPELTCISEEGIADMDLPDNLLDDLDYIGITSCNKVENYLMLSEFENNLIAETPVVMDKRGRRWSLARRSEDVPEEGGRWRLVPPKRTITVIDEASV